MTDPIDPIVGNAAPESSPVPEPAPEPLASTDVPAPELQSAPVLFPVAGPGGWVTLAVAGLGFVLLLARGFLLGCTMLGGALLLGAVLRSLLPPRLAGMLVVRSRLTDVATLALLGTAIIVLAHLVPTPTR